MKSLYIGGKKLVIDSEMYFPFTYKVSDFENFNIIGSSASKTVSIPRCPINDEIFGYIAEINRITFGSEDDEIGVSFNQTKRVSYELYNDSVLVSKGIVQITDITPTEYSINLYDEIVDLIEQLSGEENEDSYLSALDIYYNGEIYDYRMTKEAIQALVEDNHTLIPTFNLKDFETETEVYIRDPSNNKIIVDSGYEFTPAKFNSYKGWQLDFAMPVKDVIYSINQKNNGIITYSPALDSLFSNLHLNLGEPKPMRERFTQSVDDFTIVTPLSIDYQSPWELETAKYELLNLGSSLVKYNGKHKLKLSPLFFDLYPIQGTQTISIYNGLEITTSNYTNGQHIGELYFSVYLATVNSSGDNVAVSKKVLLKHDMYYGASYNTEAEWGAGYIEYLSTVTGNYEIDIDFYAALRDYATTDLFLCVELQRGVYDQNTELLAYSEYIGDQLILQTSNLYISTFSDSELIVESYKTFRNGDLLNGQSLFPKVSIKDLIISLVKTFNLDISVVNSKLYLQPKEYVIDTNTYQIDEITSIQVNNYDFSSLKINSELVDSDLLTEYEDYNQKEYAEQVVNTQYTIKKSTKDIKLPYSTPLPIVDADYYAYGDFLGYSNAGYRKDVMGQTNTGSAIQFAYLKPSINPIYIVEDTYFEAGVNSSEYLTNPEEEKWINANFSYQQLADGTFVNNGGDTGYNYIKVNRWNTLLPFLYDTDGTMLASLEVNKPLYNFANIDDSNYPVEKTLYQTYLKGLITDMYNVNTHILSVKMYIENSIDIYKIINYRNSLYRIYEISEYDPTIQGVYDVKLIRVNSISNYNLKEIIVYRDVYVNLYEYALFGSDITAYESNIDGLYGTVDKKIDDSSPYEFGGNIYPANKVFEDYSGMTRLGQSQQIHIIKKEAVNAYLKFGELDFWHWNGSLNIKNSYNLPFVLEVDDTTSTTGDVVSDYLHTKLYVAEDTRKISNFQIYEPKITNIEDIGSNTWRMYVSLRYKIDVITGSFSEDTRIKFNSIRFNYGSLSGTFNFSSIGNSAYSWDGTYLIHTFTYDISDAGSIPTSDPEIPLLAFIGSVETTQYSYLVALDGTFNASTDISVFDGRDSSNRLPIMLNPYYNIDNITNFTGNSSEPASIYLDYISYTYQFTSEEIV